MSEGERFLVVEEAVNDPVLVMKIAKGAAVFMAMPGVWASGLWYERYGKTPWFMLGASLYLAWQGVN